MMWELLAHEGIAVETTCRQWTYSELREAILERSNKWREQVSSGQTIRISDKNVLEQIISIFACVDLGLIPSLSGSSEVSADFESFENDLRKTTEQGYRFHTEVGMIFTTSGTMSSRRIVGHRLSALMQCAQDMNQVLNMNPETRTALILPLSFHYGFSMVTSTFRMGGTVLIPNDYENMFELPQFFESKQPTMIGTVPHCWMVLLRMLSPDVWNRIQTCILAGDECHVGLMQQLSQHNIDMDIHIFYGCTEVLRTCHRRWQSADPQGLIGDVLPSVHLEWTMDGVVQTGTTLCHEIVEGGRTTHISPSSWVLSDELRLDTAGLWHFVGRSSEVIKIAGIRYSPTEIEDSILQHPDVVDIVVGMMNDAITAIVQIKPGILRHEEIVLPSRLIPRYWIVIDEPFATTERFKRSRKRILQNVSQHHTRTTEPPEFLVIRKS